MADDHDAHVDAWRWHLRGWRPDWRWDGQFHEHQAAPVNGNALAATQPDVAIHDEAPHNIRRKTIPPVVVKERRGKVVWRWVGKAGADYPSHPNDAKVSAEEKAHATNLSKADRLARLPDATAKASKAHTNKGAKTRAAVLTLAAKERSRGSGLAEFIAKRLKLSVSHVRRILAARKTRITETSP